MRFPTSASGAAANSDPLLQCDDAKLPVDDNQLWWSLIDLIRSAGLGDELTDFDANNPNTYNLLTRAVQRNIPSIEMDAANENGVIRLGGGLVFVIAMSEPLAMDETLYDIQLPIPLSNAYQTCYTVLLGSNGPHILNDGVPNHHSYLINNSDEITGVRFFMQTEGGSLDSEPLVKALVIGKTTQPSS